MTPFPSSHYFVDGELLYSTWCLCNQVHGGAVFLTWSQLDTSAQLIWCDVAMMFGSEMPHSIGRNWKAELQKFGRHQPGCPIGACNCGFEQIEKELSERG